MGICFQKKYTSIDEQFKKIRLLIGLNENEQIKELNAFLQCLIHIKPLVNYIKYKFEKIKERKAYSSYHRSGKCLSDAFRDLIDKLFPNGLRIIDNNENRKDIFKTENSNKFSNMIYQIEPNYNTSKKLLIQVIIMRLHKELNKVENSREQNKATEQMSKKLAFNDFKQNFQEQYQSVISDIFFGSYYIQSLCSFCQNYFYNFQPYTFGRYSLNQVYIYKNQTLNLGQNELYMNNVFNININQINLFDCLYFDQQIKFKFQKCKNCGNIVQFYYKNIIYSSPTILTFIFNNDLAFDNISFFIAEKININIFVELKHNINYNLICMIFNTFQNYYIAYCKSPIDKH